MMLMCYAYIASKLSSKLVGLVGQKPFIINKNFISRNSDLVSKNKEMQFVTGIVSPSLEAIVLSYL